MPAKLVLKDRMGGGKSYTKRDVIYDIMKGVAMLLVMWGHISKFGFNFIYSFHMPVFFILSGLFFKKKSTKELFRIDFRRLIIPYIITCLLIMIPKLLSFKGMVVYILTAIWGSGSSLHTAHFLSHMPNVGAIWFLLALFLGRFAFNIINRLNNDRDIIIVISILFIVSTIIGRYIIVMPFSILPGLCSLPFIYYGYYLKQHDINKYILLILVFVWIFCIVCSHMNIARCYFRYFFVDVLGGIGGFIVLMKASAFIKRIDIVAGILSFIGRNSIIFLCFHLILNIYLHLSINNFFYFILQVIVCSIIVWLLSLSERTKELFKVSL